MAGQSSTAHTNTLQKLVSIEKVPQAKEIGFEVVSIKPIEKPDPDWFWGAQITPTPDGYKANPQSLWETIMLAYYQTSQSPLYWQKSMLLGAPPWLMKNQYAIDARVFSDDIEAWQKPDPEKKMLRAALQKMLRDRCKLVLHSTTTKQSVYALVIKRGAKLKLKEADPNEEIPSGASRIPNDGAMKHLDKSSVGFYKISMNYVVAFLTAFGAGRPVIDMTGLKGRYDFVLPYGEANAPGLPLDLESIGLTLKPIKAPIETLVIDHIEEPSPN
jgi:uncharacterized protein (TIGR03435 family)